MEAPNSPSSTAEAATTKPKRFDIPVICDGLGNSIYLLPSPTKGEPVSRWIERLRSNPKQVAIIKNLGVFK